MNRTRLLMIGALALALGAFVSFAVYRTLKSKTSSGNEPSVEVMVAARDIQVGSKLEDKDLRLARFSMASVPIGAYLSKNQALGTRRCPANRTGRVHPSREACRRKRWFWASFDDSAGHAGGIGTSERGCGGSGVCDTGDARRCAANGQSHR